MARTVRDTNLESRTARQRLTSKSRPFYRLLESGLHLGYRKPRSGSGKWLVRLYKGQQSYSVRHIGIADDFSDADGTAILNFQQAQAAARRIFAQHAQESAGVVPEITVERVLENYLDYLETSGKPIQNTRYRVEGLLVPSLGKYKAAKLSTDIIRRWHSEIAKSPACLRTARGSAPRFKKSPNDDESQRRRKSTANRILTILKAALNLAWREGFVESDLAWRRVQPFGNVDAARSRYLEIEEAKRLINVAPPDFRNLVEAALHTGARYGELCRLCVADFNASSGTIAIRKTKSGKPRHVVLTEEGISLFRDLCLGRSADQRILMKLSGSPWGISHQRRPMIDSCKNARITPPITFHGLRHTYASHAAMRATPLLVLARNLGHADTRMVERHYGHLAPSYLVEEMRKGAPRFGRLASNVEPLFAEQSR